MLKRTLAPLGSVSLLLAGGLALPANALPSGCSASLYSNKQAMQSLCTVASGVDYHQPVAKFYFTSGYSAWRTGPLKPAGTTSYSGVYQGGKYMDGLSIALVYV